jgi:riboflavin kinase/FMN adenylyltransferase
MQVICGIGQLRNSFKKTVAAIGVFDGVHCGHQRVIAHAVEDARRAGGKSVVVTFHPHPVRVLYPGHFHSYITDLPQRLELFSALGVSACLVVRFTRRFAQMAPEDFVRRYLCAGLGVFKVVVGQDFHFGHDREGSILQLEALGRLHGFEVAPEQLLLKGDVGIKSSLIRECIVQGDLSRVGVLLGRPYTLRGRVVKGDGRGRLLGYPTANIAHGDVVIPPQGIYLGCVILRGKRYQSMIYVGRRPSFKSLSARVVVEVNILDFSSRIYGCQLDIEILARIREDRCFSSSEDLVSQIRQDESSARAWFARNPH